LEDLKEYAALEYTNSQGYLEESAVSDGSSPLEFAKLIFNKLHLDSDEVIQKWYDFNKLGDIEFKKIYGTD